MGSNTSKEQPVESTSRTNTKSHPNTKSGTGSKSQSGTGRKSQSGHRHKNTMANQRKFVQLGSAYIKVSIIKGDLTTEQAEVIVCTASKNLDLHKGRSSKALADAAGDDMQDQCKSLYPRGIDYDEVAVVSPGRLSSQGVKKVYFVALPVWSSGGREKQLLQDVMTKCLEQASKNGCKTLALPSLGTGFLKYPVDTVANATLQSIEDFSNANITGSLKHISVIVYYQDTASFQAFEREARRRSSCSPGGTSCSPGGASGSSGGLKVKKSQSIGLGSIRAGRFLVSEECIGEIKVSIIHGKLADFKADVLVNNTANDLNLKNGGLAESLLKVAGQELQDECSDTYPNGIRPGEVAVTQGYGLKCHKVYHGSLPKWNKDKSYNSKKMLEKFVCNCLQQAETDGFSSIAFPALGTGSLIYPAQVSAQLMFNSISKHESNHKDTSLVDVYIVVFDEGNDHEQIKSTYEAELSKVLHSPDCENESSEANQYQFKVFEDILTRAMDRNPNAGAHPRGSKDWYKQLYRMDPRTPSYWTTFHSNKTLKDWHLDMEDAKPVTVPVDRPTFDTISQLVQDTWLSKYVGQGRDAHGLADLNYTRIKVRHIERIENSRIFEKYAQTRQNLFQKAANKGSCPTLEQIYGSKGPIMTCEKIRQGSELTRDMYPEVNEHYMFHGTKESVVDGIVKQGLDCRLSGTSAMFGAGVYGAESSTKADQYADPKSKRTDGLKKMLLIRMCLGEMHVQSSPKSFARAPCVQCQEDKCSCESNEFNDSVIGDGSWNFREFVVYDRTQVYPEFIISYVRE